MSNSDGTLNLRILSPSTEIDGDLSFPELPVSTTVESLKLKIQDVLPTRPSIDRMRLIYRGRVMARESDTMMNVFGQDVLQQSSDHTLHLVLRELHPQSTSSTPTATTPIPNATPSSTAASAPRASTAPPLAPNPFRATVLATTHLPPTIAGSASPANAFRPLAGNIRPQSQPPNPFINQQQSQALPPPAPPPAPPAGAPQVLLNPQPHAQQPLQFPPQFAFSTAMQAPHFPQLPPDVNQIINQHIAHAQILAHANAHANGHHHNHPPVPPPPPPPPLTSGQTTSTTQASGLQPASDENHAPEGRSQDDLQQMMASLEPQRASAGSQAGSSTNATTGLNTSLEAGQVAQSGTPQPSRSHSPQVTSTYTRDVVAPNGHRYRVNLTTGLGGQPNFGTIEQPLGQQRLQFPPMFPGIPSFARSSSPVPGMNFPRQQADSDRDIQRIRTNLAQAQREVENLRLLVLTPNPPSEGPSSATASFPPPHRLDEVRIHLANLHHSLDQVQTTLNTMVVNPMYSRSRDVVSLQMLNNSLRSQAGELAQTLGRQTLPPAPIRPISLQSTVRTQPDSGPAEEQREGSRTFPSASVLPEANSTSRPEVFMLYGPEGPYGLVFGPSGTYTTPPLPSDIAGQLYQQHSSNLDILDQLHTQYIANTQNLSNSIQRLHQYIQVPANSHLIGVNNPLGVSGPSSSLNQNTQERQNEAETQPQAQAQEVAQARAAVRAAEENDPIAAILGNIWLFVKLIAFIYFFSYGGGWRRGIVLGTVGAVVFLAQIGMFGNTFQRVRRHLEGLIPIPEDLRLPQEGENRQGGPTHERGATTGATSRRSTYPMSPEETARRLLREQQDRQMGTIRGWIHYIERAVALFIASLMPGLGERMVRAREERDRLEREEGERLEREQEQAAQAKSEATEENGEAAAVPSEMKPSAEEGSANDQEPSSSSKGKERAIERDENETNDTEGSEKLKVN